MRDYREVPGALCVVLDVSRGEGKGGGTGWTCSSPKQSGIEPLSSANVNY